jgi:hypothetical protein
LDDQNLRGQIKSKDPIVVTSDVHGSVIEYRWGSFLKTYFTIKNGMLNVNTRPIPICMPKSIRCVDIDYVESDYKIFYAGTRNSSYYTYFIAKLTNGSSMVLLKLNSARKDDDRLVNEINRILNKKPKPREASQSKYAKKIVPPEDRYYVRKD